MMKRVMFCSSLNKRLVVFVQNISINLKVQSLFGTESGGISNQKLGKHLELDIEPKTGTKNFDPLPLGRRPSKTNFVRLVLEFVKIVI